MKWGNGHETAGFSQLMLQLRPDHKDYHIHAFMASAQRKNDTFMCSFYHLALSSQSISQLSHPWRG